jgi:hypothetical protein
VYRLKKNVASVWFGAEPRTGKKLTGIASNGVNRKAKNGR